MTTTDWLTLSLVLITAFYAWATFRILRANEGVVGAMREQTEAQLRPYVVAWAGTRIGTTLLVLEIQNTGKSPAVDVRLQIDKPFHFNGENGSENLATLPAFTQPIEALAPGARLQFILGVGHTLFSPEIDETISPKVFSVHADYRFSEKRYSEYHTIDLRPLLHTTPIHDPVADEIKSLRESLEKALRK
jgi:hypothetical protein